MDHAYSSSKRDPEVRGENQQVAVARAVWMIIGGFVGYERMGLVHALGRAAGCPRRNERVRGPHRVDVIC